ncbi:MAG: glycoside hydrolase family 130 protein [Bacteroidetes bacterium]|nr:glycoside hydrolase family 130 protein [Bacteroidota bacterium]
MSVNTVFVKRALANPILCPRDVNPSSENMIVECLLNPGVFIFDNKIWLLLRVAERTKQTDEQITVPIYNEQGQVEFISFKKNDPLLQATDPRVLNYGGKDYLTTISHLRLVCSHDGKNFYAPDGYKPIYGQGQFEEYGIEDCRVTQIGKTYLLTYTMVSSLGVGVGLIQTTDWKVFERQGMIFPPHNKDCAIFPDKINGKYYALHRPSSPQLGGNYIWLAESNDLIHWGNNKCIATTRKGEWDSARIGAGAAPIKTSEGWLEIYHGADEKHRYCLGALLLDLHNPSKVIARSKEPIMVPEAEYELTGFFGNVIFTNGHHVIEDTIHLYYGASDEVICQAELSVRNILDSLLKRKNCL